MNLAEAVGQTRSRLIDEAIEEARATPQVEIPLSLDLNAAYALVGALRLSLENPAIRGRVSEEVARAIIAGIIEALDKSGMKACAELLRLTESDRVVFPTESDSVVLPE